MKSIDEFCIPPYTQTYTGVKVYTCTHVHVYTMCACAHTWIHKLALTSPQTNTSPGSRKSRVVRCGDYVVDVALLRAKFGRQCRCWWLVTLKTKVYIYCKCVGIVVDPRPEVDSAIQLRDVTHFSGSCTLTCPVDVQSDVVRITIVAKISLEGVIFDCDARAGVGDNLACLVCPIEVDQHGKGWREGKESKVGMYFKCQIQVPTYGRELYAWCYRSPTLECSINNTTRDHDAKWEECVGSIWLTFLNKETTGMERTQRGRRGKMGSSVREIQRYNDITI